MPNEMASPPGAAPATSPDDDDVPWQLWAATAGAVVVGIALRLVAGTPLWLDEALSANIASLPPGEQLDALARDGHPPLYYLLLHGWMAVAGTSDAAVRALSGLVSVAALAAAWSVGRRLGGRRLAVTVVGVLAMSAFAIRYATETRMYALVVLLVFVGWLLLDDVRRGRGGWWCRVGLALVAGALLLTHYWAIFLLGTVGGLVLVRAWRAGPGETRRRELVAAGSVAAGALLFLPWLPTFLEQAAHTGTPWGDALRPTEVLGITVQDLGGGGLRDAVAGAGLLVVLGVLGVAGRPSGGVGIELNLRGRPPGRVVAVVVLGTLLVGSTVALASGATFASRYAAVVLPGVVVLVALGIGTLRNPWVAAGALVAVSAFGLAGEIEQLRGDRTQAEAVAVAIDGLVADEGPAVVVYCPDQLAPAYDRALAGPATLEGGGRAGERTGVIRVVYPTFEVWGAEGGDGLPDGARAVDGPVRVDWYDYRQRNDAADPERFAADVLDLADGRGIALVWSTGYATYEGDCEGVRDALADARADWEVVVEADGLQYFEPAWLTWYPPVQP